MTAIRARSGIARLLLSAHPWPSFTVAAICAALGLAILPPWRIAVVGLAVLFGQFSVGLSNDWLDAERDRPAGRTDKPVAMGELGESTARNAAIIAGAFGLVLTLGVGVPATLAHAVFIAAGWAYNLGVKKTGYSVVPYIVGFGVLPDLEQDRLTGVAGLPHRMGRRGSVIAAGIVFVGAAVIAVVALVSDGAGLTQ